MAMVSEQRTTETSRRAIRTLHVVAGFYVVVGLVVAGAAALSGDRLSTFLGFLIISAALAAAVVVHSVLRLHVHLAAIAAKLDDIRERLHRLERPAAEDRSGIGDLTVNRTECGAPARIINLNLASTGSGDPAELTAATLERHAFPRLASTMDEFPPERGAFVDTSGEDRADRVDSVGESLGKELTALNEGDAMRDEPVVLRDLMREWRKAKQECDAVSCRRIYAAMVDTVGIAETTVLATELRRVEDRVEAQLREEFTGCVRRQDFRGALAVGERITSQLAGRAVVQDFAKLRSALLRRAASQPVADTPRLNLVR